MPSGFTFLPHEAGAFAVVFLRTNAAGDGGKHVVFANLRGSSQKIAGHDQLYKLANFYAHGAMLSCRPAWHIPNSVALPDAPIPDCIPDSLQ